MVETNKIETIGMEKWVETYRGKDPDADRWANGFGRIIHSVETQWRVFTMADWLAASGVQRDRTRIFELFEATDRVASAAMWLVVHETYARNVYLDGRDLKAEDFKEKPEGHTGGSLNMVPAYVGYMAANTLTDLTRSWIMGQGHSVAAIDSTNLLLANMTDAHSKRYALSDEGLTRYVRDFYSYRLREDGTQDSPLGSHVNAHTAGGLAEGGYLGFVELQYVHMPLPGEQLVVFLSDGAFEEQRGSDWAPRWWRAEDCGLVTPIMIKNGRRIDQRTTLSQQGGTEWFVRHLELNGFDPVVFDGKDPAAFAWAILEMEHRLEAGVEAIRSRGDSYPLKLPYGIAVAPKGAGFYGEGTNLAHNLPLMSNPHDDPQAARHFNESARHLYVPKEELEAAVKMFQNHKISGRPRERDHALVDRWVSIKELPEPTQRPILENRMEFPRWTRTSPMQAVDSMFSDIVRLNPHLRPRVGNPDEMRSNRLQKTLDSLKFRVTDPEPGIPEDMHGAVITALNEEAVASAALGNKGGINLVHTYEAFGMKMHGVVRQEIMFANHCNEIGRIQGWLSVPLVLTSHTWENAKNELSHQDPAMAEAMLNELSDVSRVLFIPDYNSALAVMSKVYLTHGQIWTLVVPKQDVIPDLFSMDEAILLLEEGAMRLNWAGYDLPNQRLVLTALGAYQLEQVLLASSRMADRKVPHSVVYMLEPGRFRIPRTKGERTHMASDDLKELLYPPGLTDRIFVTHTRPEPLIGTLHPLHTGYGNTVGLGFIGRGGTLTVEGMLFVNSCTWAHILSGAAGILKMPREGLLSEEELASLDGRESPHGVIIP